MSRSRPEAILYTRRSCHLCGRARAILETIARDTPLAVREADVDASPELVERFGHTVPVIEIGGRVVAAGRVSEYRLRRALGVPPTPRAVLGLARAIVPPVWRSRDERRAAAGEETDHD